MLSREVLNDRTLRHITTIVTWYRGIPWMVRHLVSCLLYLVIAIFMFSRNLPLWMTICYSIVFAAMFYNLGGIQMDRHWQWRYDRLWKHHEEGLRESSRKATQQYNNEVQ